MTLQVTDSGAWYSGRSWTARGNVLRDNVFADIRRTAPVNTRGEAGPPLPVTAVYFDDQLSGQIVVNNTILRCERGVHIGGGRDTAVSGNYCADTDVCVNIDSRGLSVQRDMCTANASYTGLLVAQILAVNFTLPPYAVAFPSIVSTLSNSPCSPVNISVRFNRYCTSGTQQRFIDVSSSQTAAWSDSVANNTRVSC